MCTAWLPLVLLRTPSAAHEFCLLAKMACFQNLWARPNIIQCVSLSLILFFFKKTI
jgi:hypothetical protein